MRVIAYNLGGNKQQTTVEKPKAEPVKAPAGDKNCSECGRAIDREAIITFSVQKFGRPLCMECQKKAK